MRNSAEILGTINKCGLKHIYNNHFYILVREKLLTCKVTFLFELPI